MSRRRKKRDPVEEAKLYIENGEDREGFERLFINTYKGCGTFTTKEFEQGDFLLEYKGQLIRHDEGERRLKSYPKSSGSFLYFFESKGCHYCIDATYQTNDFGRFVNDSKRRPNCRMQVVESLEAGIHVPHLCLFALCYLTTGEELQYDYGDTTAFWRKCGKAVPVIIQKHLIPLLQFLTDEHVRGEAGISRTNPYVFASPGAGVVRGYDALVTIVNEANLEKPERVRATNMRRLLATLCQVRVYKKNKLS